MSQSLVYFLGRSFCAMPSLSSVCAVSGSWDEDVSMIKD